ncbi:MAG: tetratricopeptide repeat protein [Thermoanaerobaculales bacterium]|nr:tetratricopeptide repeat protein [Thermoanaerobaculales bacterium]
MARRITRKQLKQDEFVSTMDQLIRKFRDYWKPAAAGLGAVLVIVFFWWVAVEWSERQTEEASALLQKAVTAYNEAAALDPVGDLTEAESGFADVIKQYGRTTQGDVARMYEARIALGRGEIEEARTALIKLVDRHKGDALGRLAALDMVRLRVASGQGAEVAKELEAMVVGRNSQLPRDAALYELGEVFIEEKNADQAKEYFQKLVDEFPESPYVAKARQRLTELG